eukprot:228605-Rhodomonas_salina.2
MRRAERIGLRACYAMPGTGLAYGCDVRYYAIATHCPVLTLRMLLPGERMLSAGGFRVRSYASCYAMPGTDIPHPLPAYAMPGTDLGPRSWAWCIGLRLYYAVPSTELGYWTTLCYVVSGTVPGYQPTRVLRDVRCVCTLGAKSNEFLFIPRTVCTETVLAFI